MINLSKPQKSVYNMEKFAGGSIAVICSSMLRVGTIDADILKLAVNTLYRLNNVLRTRIVETPDGTKQTISDYSEQDFQVLTFENQSAFSEYAENYAKQPIDMYGSLCDVKIIFLENKYGLLVKLHHIIGDAWTMSLLAKQFTTILDGEMPETYSYIDYLQSEEEYTQSKRYQKDKQFFIKQFSKCDDVTYLSDKQDTHYNADRKTFILTTELTKQISTLAETNNSSIFAVIITLFEVYFSRIKMNTEKFYIGTPVLNRTGIKEQNTVGMFINTVPLLAEIENEKTFAENLQISTDNIMSLLRHQHYNYEDLLSTLRTEYNFTEKLYDVILSYQNAKTNAKDFQTEWHSCGMQTESLQIHIDDRDSVGVLTINYDYRTDKFTEKEIERMHEHIFNLFIDVAKNKNKKIYELEMLSNEEKNRLLYEFNDTKADYPKDKCIHQLFEEQVLKTPNKTAVIACDQTLTYDELNRLSNRITNSLIEKGIGVGDIVAFALPRTSYMIAVMFGILKSGAAYMPLDPDYPQDRIDFMISDSNAKLLITEEILKSLLENESENNPAVSISQDNIFCALHTSGSTGKPKLALLTHKNLMAFLYANRRFYNEVDATVSVTVVTFDIFMQDTLLSIAYGVKTILSSTEQIYNQVEFEKLFSDVKAALFFATPTKLKNYINQSKSKEFLKHIKVFVVGGEVFTNDLYELISTYINKSDLYNGYGPTETTIGSSYTLLPIQKNNVATIDSQIYNIYGPTEATICVSTHSLNT